MNQNPIVVRYERWMNWCHFIGHSSLFYVIFLIAQGGVGSLTTVGGLFSMTAIFAVVVTNTARSRFRARAINDLRSRGIDLQQQLVVFF